MASTSTCAVPLYDQLPWELLSEPARIYFQWIQGRYDLTPIGASMAALVGVLCAVGTRRRVISPIDYSSVPPAFSLVLHGDTSLHTYSAVNLGLVPIRELIQERAGEGGRGASRQARMRIAELHEQLIHQNILLQSARSKPVPGLEPCMMTEKELSARRSEIESQRALILLQLEEQAFRLAPHLLADDVAMRQLLFPELLSYDGTVLYASWGHAITSWCHSSRVQKAELGRLLVNSWQGILACGLDGPSKRALSSVIVTDTANVRVLLGDGELTRQGVIQELFFVDARVDEVTGELAEPPEGAIEQWSSRLKDLVSARITGKDIEHQLESDALKHFESFQRDILAQASNVEAWKARQLERAPILSLKLAILLHAACSTQSEVGISNETIKFATALACSVSTSTVSLLHAHRLKDGPSSQQHEEEREIDDLVTKLRLRGPLRWRELLRSRHSQRAGPLADLLEKAVRSGRIIQKGGHFEAAEQSIS